MYLQRFKRHTAILATSLTLSVSAFVGISTAYAQTAAWESTTDLSQPESVVYDSATNLLYVSNAATDATTGDPAGYISTVDPATGKVVTKEWLTGLGDITGLAIHGTTLYVAETPKLVEISLTDKKVTNTYSVAEGTTAPAMLNDVSADPSGNVYVTDMTGNKIYCLCGGKFEVWSDNAELVSPNGILADAMTGSLVVVTTDAATKVGKLKLISTAEGKAVSTIATLDNVTLLDGLAYDEGTGYYITDFGGKLFLADETGKVTELMAGEIDFASADLTYLPANNVLVIPIMDETASKLVALTPTQVALNVDKTVTATGTGTVTSTPGLATGINCGKDCKEATEYYAPATEVKLTATADEGSTLASWGGDCKDMTGNEVTLKMDAAKTCEVNFESTAVTNLALAITLAGNGTVKSEPAGIDCGTTCNASFAPNTAVVLTATPADDSLFKQWDGDCAAAGVATTANVTLDAAKNCTATFELKPVVAKNALTITLENGGDATAAVISNDGGIKCGIADGSCTKEYDLGTVVTLSVTSTTVTLLGWSGACTGTELTTTVTMDAAKECKATFGTVTKRTLNVKMEGTGAGYVISDPAGGIDCNKDTTADCTEFYPQGTVVTLKLDDSRPLTGTTFKGWSGGCTGTDPAVQITMDADKECIATFDMLTSPFNTLTVTLAGEGKVTSDPAGIDCGTACTKDYPKDGVVTLTATITNPALGFIGWTGDCTGTEATTKVTLDNLKNCTATFGNTVIAPPPPAAGTTFPLTVTLQGTGLGMVTSTPAGISCGTDCTEDYAAATVVTVVAQANPGSTFAGWSGACMGAASPTTITMDAAKSCTAAFTAAVGVSPTTPTGTVSTSVNSSTGYYDTAKALVIGTYNANGNVLKNVTIDVYANVKNAVFMGTIKNNGWISNSTIASGTTVEGGTLTGYIKNEGTISNFTFLGASITGGTLAGTILNNSKVGGAFINVTLAANAKVKGGILQGTIKGDKKAPATLENVVVKAGSHLSGVTLGANVTLGKGVVIEKDEEPTTPTTPTTPPVELPEMPSLGTALATDPTGKPIPTTAKFTGGIALNDGTTFDGEGQAKPLTDVVDLHGGITVDTAHVGKKADVFVYASYQATADDKPFHFMLDSKGAIQVWDQKVENLVAFQAGVTLSSLAEVKIYQGVLLSPGILKVHFGYRLEDGTVVETPKSIDLSVSDKKADTTGESTDREDTTDTDTEGTTDTGETDKTDTGETDKTDTGETDTTDTGKDNCGPDCDTTDTGKTDKTDTGKTDKTDTGKTDKTDTGKTDKTDTGKTDKTDTGKTDKTDTGKTDKTDTGKTDKTDTGKTDKTDTGKTDKTDTGKTDKTDTGKTDKTDTGKTDKTDTGKTDKTDTGKTDKTDTGKTDKTDTGKTDKTDTGKTDKTDTGKTDKTDTGK